MKEIFEESGWLAINKPEGIESFGIIRELKFKFKFKKIGFVGTLDPLASGVLLVAINKATKLIPKMHLKNKHYELIIFFGAETKSLDIESRYTNYKKLNHDLEKRLEKIRQFIGSYNQKIPIFSAHKINGKNFYQLARKNQNLTHKYKGIEVSSLKIISNTEHTMSIKIECSAGFYVRSFASELSYELNELGYAISIKRTKIGDIDINKCLDIQNILDFSCINDLYSAIIPIYSGRHPG